MSTMPNDRSDAALRERLGIAEKATQGPWKSDEVVTRKKDFEPSYVVKDKDGFTIVDVIPVSAYQANAAHIAASSPDVVRADIEEILRLRKEVARLELENQRLAVDGINGEAYLLTCLDIIRKAVGMPVGSDWQQVAERVERLSKEADWLANAAENGGCLSGEVCPRCPNGYHERKRCYGKDMRLAAHDAVMKKRRKSCKN